MDPRPHASYIICTLTYSSVDVCIALVCVCVCVHHVCLVRVIIRGRLQGRTGARSRRSTATATPRPPPTELTHARSTSTKSMAVCVGLPPCVATQEERAAIVMTSQPDSAQPNSNGSGNNKKDSSTHDCRRCDRADEAWHHQRQPVPAPSQPTIVLVSFP